MEKVKKSMKIRRSFIKISAAFMAAAIALTLCGCQKTCADSFIPGGKHGDIRRSWSKA